ncbi:Tyrosine recombinase XerC [Stieleria maiorica]|uniref:Tyrosine recombinase XerC n=1 Tax=Stieleria maiorica TaxID=2795974 RepID=A0A5B9MN94_9BACT|nr:tyrosine-type recombinase/integrase [Stieleria maiorica]QEG01531.1 Tyrosine recombinase XerC [Stieleria maiorica]
MSYLLSKAPPWQTDIESFTNSVPVIETPALVDESGPAARFAWEEFVYGRIRNPHTRKAYGQAVRQFLRYCERLGRDLSTVTPRDVSTYLDHLDYATSTKKLHLSGLRHFFDVLVTRHVVFLNPATAVRSERLQVVEGKTPEISIIQARQLIHSIDVSNVVGLRDRAIIGILIYTAARVGAVSSLNHQDFFSLGDQYCLRFTEKRGKVRQIPTRHDLRGFIRDYLTAGGLNDSDRKAPLFRTTVRRTKSLTRNRMTPGDMGRMVKRRMRQGGLPNGLSPHSFRVTTITDLLSQGVPLEDVQNLAGHADPRTTRLYDRRQRRITRNIVERISI